MAVAVAEVPPKVPRSCMPPALDQRNAWDQPLLAVDDEPTTWPASLMAAAALVVPPRVPRSVIKSLLPFRSLSRNQRSGLPSPSVSSGVTRKAWVDPSGVVDEPTTWPALLMSL